MTKDWQIEQSVKKHTLCQNVFVEHEKEKHASKYGKRYKREYGHSQNRKREENK